MKSTTVLNFKPALCCNLSRKNIILERAKQATMTVPDQMPEQRMLLYTNCFYWLKFRLIKEKQTLHILSSTLRNKATLHCESGQPQERTVHHLDCIASKCISFLHLTTPTVWVSFFLRVLATPLPNILPNCGHRISALYMNHNELLRKVEGKSI